MNFQNDSAYMLMAEGCAKGRGMDDSWKKEFAQALSKEAEEKAHKEAMDILIGYMKDAIDCGMYYDVMRFLIKCMIYEDESFDYEGLYMAMGQEPALDELLPYAAEYAQNMKKKNGPADDEMAAFFLKTKSIFSDDFGRFLYGNMKKCNLSYDMNMTEAQVDAIAKSVNKKARPGVMLCLIDYVYAGRTKNVEIFWYAMRKYILPVLGTYKYTEKKTNEQAIFRNLAGQYAFYVYNVVYLKYILAKEEGQTEDDPMDPLVRYWDKDDSKKAIDADVIRFYESLKKVLPEVLSAKNCEGFQKMVEILQQA